MIMIFTRNVEKWYFNFSSLGLGRFFSNNSSLLTRFIMDYQNVSLTFSLEKIKKITYRFLVYNLAWPLFGGLNFHTLHNSQLFWKCFWLFLSLEFFFKKYTLWQNHFFFVKIFFGVKIEMLLFFVHYCWKNNHFYVANFRYLNFCAKNCEIHSADSKLHFWRENSNYLDFCPLMLNKYSFSCVCS